MSFLSDFEGGCTSYVLYDLVEFCQVMHAESEFRYAK